VTGALLSCTPSMIDRGSPGIDGMTVGELSGYLKQHWPTIPDQLLCGTYRPQPV
jgi:RNA-directed DNA polymerase